MVLCNGRDGCFLLFYVWALCRVERIQEEAATWLGETVLPLLSLWWMANLLFPKDLSRDFLALAASKRHCIFQNPAEGIGKYQEVENTCIIPSYKTFLTSWQMKGRPGACLQEDLGFSSWAFSCMKPCSKYVGSAYRAGLWGAIHWELLFYHNPNVLGVKTGECCCGGDSQESRAAVCFTFTCEALFQHENRMHRTTGACSHEHLCSFWALRSAELGEKDKRMLLCWCGGKALQSPCKMTNVVSKPQESNSLQTAYPSLTFQKYFIFT